MTRGGRVLPAKSVGAEGANPPRESLRPLYRRSEATLESSPVTGLTDGASVYLILSSAETLRSQTEWGGKIFLVLHAT